jgi:hypothetical protein
MQISPLECKSNFHCYFFLGQARSTFRVVRATLAKFGLHAGNMKLDSQNEE